MIMNYNELHMPPENSGGFYLAENLTRVLGRSF